jgi:hypothetical protein
MTRPPLVLGRNHLCAPRGFCQCGCGQQTTIAPVSNRSKGWTRGEPLLYVRGHVGRVNPRRRVPSPADYIVEDRGFTSPCWMWQGVIAGGTGYGQVGDGGKTIGAHRWYYQHFVGPIADGLVIDHLCRNRACVNPDHLEPVTTAENSRRGSRAKLTHELVEYIRASSAPNGQIAQELGIHNSVVSRVRSGEAWAT